MNVEILLPYAGLLGLVLIALSIQVVILRRRHQVGIGFGQVQALERAIRTQANFTEYVPLALVLLVLLGISGALPDAALHLLAGALVVGRILHAVGLSRSAGTSFGRLAGTALTWLVLLAAAGMALVLRVF
ncbi:MAG: glutathione S-transferase [Gammaproteobacteria bacterium]|nr:glutathione S-transferase [Gammaproteobacteria bacterium]